MHLSYAKLLMKKTREDYDDIAEEFSATRKIMWPEFGDLDKYVKEGGKVLDIGCGNGKLFGYLAGKKKDFSYIGLDVSEKLISIAKQNFKERKAEFAVFDGINIPYPDNDFDAIYCLATLPHLPGREMRVKFLENIRKTAKPGAKLIITCWNLWQLKFIKHQLKSILNFIIDKILGNGKYDWGDLYIPWHKQSGKIINRYYHAFTLSELSGILKKTGWKVEEIGYKERRGKKRFNLFAAACPASIFK